MTMLVGIPFVICSRTRLVLSVKAAVTKVGLSQVCNHGVEQIDS